MWNVKPGDLVVCVRRKPWLKGSDLSVSPVQIPYGAICTVAEVVFREDGLMGFVLEGHRPFKWVANYFRPVAKPSIENLRSLLTKPNLTLQPAEYPPCAS